MDLMEKITNLAKRRGFIFAGSEIYGGLANSWDYGPLGTELKKNIKDFLAKSRNKRTIIMHDLIARLFISVSTRKAKLIPGFHPKDVGIGK